jgi:hypothetical protein
MANAFYTPGLEGILDRTIDVTAGTIKAALTRGGTFSAAHKFLSEVSGLSVVAQAALGGKTYTGGVLDAGDVTFTAVAAGAACNAVIIYNDTGTPSTSRLIAWIDTGTGLPVTPTGGDILVSWDSGANKIAKI